MSVIIRKGNRSPSLTGTITQAGVPFDLTGSSVKLKMRLDGSSALKVDAAASVVSASTTLSGEHVLPEPSITVVSTSGFIPSGALTVGGQIVFYEEISGNTFLGCRGGYGTIASGATVAQRGGVQYDWAAADVDTAGDYIAWWEVTLPSGKIQESPSFDVVIEDPLAVSQGLCELADVISYAPGYARKQDASTNALLERLILAESRAIQRETGREFRAISPAANPRRFDLGPWHVRERRIAIGDLASAPSAVRVIDCDQTTVVQTLSAESYVLLPRVRQAWEPITGLAFPAATSDPAHLAVGRVLEVDGSWGFPVVPDDIREACARLVLFRYVSDAAQAGTLLAESLAEVAVGALFASARSVVESYRTTLAA